MGFSGRLASDKESPPFDDKLHFQHTQKNRKQKKAKLHLSVNARKTRYGRTRQKRNWITETVLNSKIQSRPSWESLVQRGKANGDAFSRTPLKVRRHSKCFRVCLRLSGTLKFNCFEMARWEYPVRLPRGNSKSSFALRPFRGRWNVLRLRFQCLRLIDISVYRRKVSPRKVNAV